jgi:hypothetical protein
MAGVANNVPGSPFLDRERRLKRWTYTISLNKKEHPTKDLETFRECASGLPRWARETDRQVDASHSVFLSFVQAHHYCGVAQNVN